MTLVQTEPKKITMRTTSRLPAEYQEVEWIWWTNWSNTQEQVYIDTWITTSNNIWAWTEMLHTATRDNVQWFTNTLPNNTVRRWLTTYPSWKWCPQWETRRQTDIAYNINQFYDIKLNWNNNKKCDIDWTTIYNCTNTAFSSNNTIRIWDISYNWYWWKCKFFKISDGTTLVRDLVPCYRKSDSVIWMYDVVNDVFYTNSWTWTFTKWSDVPNSNRTLDFKKIYVWSQKVRPVWKPDSTRTIFYYDFENNLNDGSWNHNNITSSNYISYEQVGRQYVSYINNWSWYLQISSTLWASIWSGDFAISFWIYPKQPASNKYPMIFWMFDNISPFTWPTIFFDPYNKNWHWDSIFFRMTWWSSNAYDCGTASALYNAWHHIVMTRISWVVYVYIDNVLKASWNNDTNVFPTTSNSSWYILFSNNGVSQQRGVTWVKWDKVILENVWWSAQDVKDYYNQIKLNYWL